MVFTASLYVLITARLVNLQTPSPSYMDPSGSELDSSLPQPETPCLIVEDSQPDSIALEDDPESSYRALLTKRLSNLQPHSPSPVLVSVGVPLLMAKLHWYANLKVQTIKVMENILVIVINFKLMF